MWFVCDRCADEGAWGCGLPWYWTLWQGQTLCPSCSKEVNGISLVFDGGVKDGNPGIGYGSYAIGTEITRVDFGRLMTSNEAEYESLIAGLSSIPCPENCTVKVCGDSALVINQVAGLWKTKNERMRVLRDKVRMLLDRFAGYALQTQPREDSVRLLGH